MVSILSAHLNQIASILCLAVIAWLVYRIIDDEEKKARYAKTKRKWAKRGVCVMDTIREEGWKEERG